MTTPPNDRSPAPSLDPGASRRTLLRAGAGGAAAVALGGVRFRFPAAAGAQEA
jgi:hypothetical protein